MRISILSLSLFFAVSFLFVGCHDNNNSSDGQARSENDFFADPSLKANGLKDTVVMFLESPSNVSANQTGTPGLDEFTYSFSRSVPFRMCWGDVDPESAHFMELFDSQGNMVLSVEANGECATADIEAGDYKVILNHDARTESNHIIFLVPDPQDAQQAREADGFIGKLRLLAANTIQKIRNTVTTDVNAQDLNPPGVVAHLNSCVSCDLEGIDLAMTDLSLVFLFASDLTGAILSCTNLTSVDLTDTTLIDVNFGGSYHNNTIFLGAVMEGATWCDKFCICQEPSNSECDGCKPSSEDCTLELAIERCFDFENEQPPPPGLFDPDPDTGEQI